MTAANYCMVGKKLRVAKSAGRRSLHHPGATRAPWDTVSRADPSPKPNGLCVCCCFSYRRASHGGCGHTLRHSALELEGKAREAMLLALLRGRGWHSFLHCLRLPPVSGFLHELCWVSRLPPSRLHPQDPPVEHWLNMLFSFYIKAAL